MADIVLTFTIVLARLIIQVRQTPMITSRCWGIRARASSPELFSSRRGARSGHERVAEIEPNDYP